MPSDPKRTARARGERERVAGIDPDDEAGRWLAAHEPVAPPPVPKRPGKNKALHRFRRRQPPGPSGKRSGSDP